MLCRNKEQAKDLTSETFYRAFVSFDKKEEKLKYWLFRVLKNLYIDEKRKKPWVLMENIEVPVEESPLTQLLKTEQRMVLYEKILLLPKEYSELLVLFYFSNFSVREIALMTGATEPGVKMKLMRAQNKLKGSLENEEKL
ncbi:RNA polymerase sigma-70 factor, ECF subfamily [Proteiniclasticum ruminis]|uniref:RNA polymerase sigma-70 factor, ECF subfamily n=1 Tax=Proteiniclasticum ruminis TaxID=398199 RepID=A0A1G8IEA0_9CLOT|nr:RNA polymerase sigma-70 factor, ECF subfamily [Proteiniclasticum ruminis]